ncbi:peptidoglycan-binding protein [Streptomyces sp. NBC_01795]|uniref:peptidoglycan-binding protein n=1 Tax=Streptomyces sp. NBC_01795 TaxID=2975943 RepID=UPI002DDAF732|nr:peptidoglycan-binding protein [Streptomyces sp. NBC_01795]WSA95848.1 peptidoglycan-binding protein [Streptomyces sp. NBC_01795]
MTLHEESASGGRSPRHDAHDAHDAHDNGVVTDQAHGPGGPAGTGDGTVRTDTDRDGPVHTDEDQAGGEDIARPVETRRRRPLRASLLVLAAVTAVGAAGVAATGAFGGEGDTAKTPRTTGPKATAKVERTTLTRTETVDGTLGFGTPTTVQQAGTGSGSESGSGSGSEAGSSESGGRQGAGQSSRNGGSGTQDEDSGIVTWLPEEGDTLSRGDTVYSVDERKVPLLYGSKPLYRTLRGGTEGDDVKTLEANLAKLGYTGFTADDEFTSGTAEAVRDWQDDMNRTETGEVEPGDAVVAPGARRVAEQKTSPGALAGGEALTWTGTGRIVTVDLEAGLEDLVKKGTKASIGLPDGGSAEAEVTDIGTPTSTDASGSSGSGSEGGESEGGADEATLPVELKVGSQRKLGRYQAASVDVRLKAESREDVLAVPVNALLAQQGGGYAVEVTGADGTTRRKPVTLGMFADGKVEVSGKGIKEGLDVGVPR